MLSNWRFFLAGLLLIGASGLAYALRPTPIVEARDVNLEHQIPTSFGEWHEVRTGLVQVDLAPRGENGEEEASLRWPYDQTLTRVYQRADGQMIMLALAWGSKQRQEIKVHRPELCYAGQGLQIVEQRHVSIDLSPGASVEANRLLTRNASRVEPVTYWIRIGDNIMAKGRKVRVEIFQQALHGRIPDGILFRVSQALSPSASADASYRVQEAFIRELLSSVDQGGRRLLIGSVGSGS
jgi:EpsI family protein